MTKIEAMKQALEVLEGFRSPEVSAAESFYQCGEAMRALRTAIAEAASAPAQEPVALRDALAGALSSVYVCGRVWDAWSVDTMTEDDFQPAAECDEVLDSLVEAVAKATPPAQPAGEPDALHLAAMDLARKQHDRIAELEALLVTSPAQPAVPLTELIDYILQDDIQSRLTPRVVDIAYSAFMIAKQGKNKDDGGPCDWFNDTKPMVMEALTKIRKDLSEAAHGIKPTAARQGGEGSET